MRMLPLFLMLAATPALAAPFPQGDPATGQKLFEQHRCDQCHIDIVGGDGSALFTRSNRKVRNAQDMVAQMQRCSAAAGITLSPSDEQHLGAYLNRYYHLK